MCPLETDPAPALSASSFWGISPVRPSGHPKGLSLCQWPAATVPKSLREPQFLRGAVSIRPKGPGGRAWRGGRGRSAGLEAALGGR